MTISTLWFLLLPALGGIDGRGRGVSGCKSPSQGRHLLGWENSELVGWMGCIRLFLFNNIPSQFKAWAFWWKNYAIQTYSLHDTNSPFPRGSTRRSARRHWYDRVFVIMIRTQCLSPNSLAKPTMLGLASGHAEAPFPHTLCPCRYEF